MEWLPELICCDGEWDTVIENLYAKFRADFVEDAVSFLGRRVRLPFGPKVENKERVFWHLISKGERENERIPEFRRCERIGWIRPIIDNADDPRLHAWEQDRSEKNIALALPDFSYIVFLAQRRPKNGESYVMLMTAYNIEGNKQREKYKRECNRCRKIRP